MAVVYWIHLPEHNDMFSEGYVGVSNNSRKRYKQHFTLMENEKHENVHLLRAYKKYGTVFEYSIILEAEEEYCYDIERKLRPTKDIGWNIAEGGNKPPSMKGRKLPPFSEEHRKNLGMARKGKKHTDEQKAKIAAASQDVKDLLLSYAKQPKSKEHRLNMKVPHIRKCYYNPINKKNRYFIPGQQPDGWVQGKYKETTN